MTNQNFAGTYTALVTPFNDDGSIDYDAYGRLIEFQIESGVTGVVPLGTTGESPTMSFEEMQEVFRFVVEQVNERVQIIAGTGSNCTYKAVLATQAALSAGVDACLVVSPYYNKPTQEGLLQHFMAVAEVGLPVVVYNIQGRTGVNIETDTLMQLAQHPNIVAVKEASGNIDQIREVIERRPEGFSVLSGDDSLTLELIRMGGDGVVSVSSNIVPAEMSQMVLCALNGDFNLAQEIHDRLLPMFSDLFVETNPIPVKYAVYRQGRCALNFRLPMCLPSQQTQDTIDAMISNYNLA